MNKLAIISLLLGVVGGTALTSDISELNSRQITPLNNNKILDINFDTNEIKNTVNNKIYSSAKGKGSLVNSIKGKGFQTNSDYIKIPSTDLNIPTSQDYVTVSCQYKYGGTDTNQMIFGFGTYDLWFYNGWLGFNTGVSDKYGISFNPSTNEYVSITAVFHKSDVTKNKLYINGVKQNLTYPDNYRQTTISNPFSSDFYISCWGNPTDGFVADGANIIDEVKIIKGDITDSQAEKLAMAHRIPELSVRQEGLKAQVNWATEILESDLIYNYDFEPGGYLPQLTWSANIVGDVTGGQKVAVGEAYSGSQSLYTPRTYGGMGNWYSFPATRSDKNIMMFSRQYFENGTKLSLSMRIKDGENVSNTTGASGDGGWGSSLHKLGAIIVEDTPAGSRTLKVNNLTGIAIGNYITSDRNVEFGAESCLQIRDITTNADGTYTLHMNGGFVFAQKAGENVHTRPWRGAYGFGSITHSTPNWTLYNLNTSVYDNADYDVSTRGGSFFLSHHNEGDAYIDDLKFGYATKVRLYRDNNLIYEGYESQLTDANGIDRVAPVMGDVKVDSVYEGSNRKITLSFKTVVDTGTTYNYSIKSIGASGKETFLSENKSITVTSGLKGYSYVIDKNPTTVPGNTTNLSASATSIQYNIPKTDTGTYYLHIKAIDNQGNVGATKHILIDNPILTTEPKPAENMIRLDWSMNNKDNKIFKVYQKKEGSSEFQSIGNTNFTSEVKVLNIYPVTGISAENTIIPSETFTNWKGETFTMPQSARLKRWMEEPNTENPKGYGKGLISVDGVGLDSFNANPDSYLKNPDGSWKYNVIMIGSWDYNGNRYGNSDMSQTGANKIQEFVNDGYGLLIGHDVASTINPIMLNQFKDDIKIQIRSVGSGSGTAISVKKKGVLTNFPWQVDENLTIPHTHTQSQVCYGDVWMTFDNFTGSDSSGGSVNAYLTTWNNVAMIQTGHSGGKATPDEQKILANTLFYLNQLSTDNFLDDYSGQDVKAPNKPVVRGYSFNTNGQITYSLDNGVDNGSTYEYYVQSENMNGNEITLSNIAIDTITSGFKGFSYVVDKNPSTIPDDIVDTASTNITANVNSNNMYLHVKAIDNAGNVSETTHYQITDTSNPIIRVTLSPSTWTNGSVTLTATATDNGSGVKYLILPNGNTIKGASGTYTVSKNGVYYFKAIDYMGNETTCEVVVSNIDNKKPTVTITNNQNWTNKDVQVTITARDE